MLSDQTTYEKLEKDPTRKYKAELIRMINSFGKRGEDHQGTALVPVSDTREKYQGCIDHHNNPHKERVPLRLIVDYKQTIR